MDNYTSNQEIEKILSESHVSEEARIELAPFEDAIEIVHDSLLGKQFYDCQYVLQLAAYALYDFEKPERTIPEYFRELGDKILEYDGDLEKVDEEIEIPSKDLVRIADLDENLLDNIESEMAEARKIVYQSQSPVVNVKKRYEKLVNTGGKEKARNLARTHGEELLCQDIEQLIPEPGRDVGELILENLVEEYRERKAKFEEASKNVEASENNSGDSNFFSTEETFNWDKIEHELDTEYSDSMKGIFREIDRIEEPRVEDLRVAFKWARSDTNETDWRPEETSRFSCLKTAVEDALKDGIIDGRRKTLNEVLAEYRYIDSRFEKKLLEKSSS